MRHRSSWFFGILFAAAILEGCSSATAPGADGTAFSLTEAYRVALSHITLDAE